MKTINNFDQSTSGINLELNCFYDQDLSRHYYCENFKTLNDDLLVFTDFGNCGQDFDLTDVDNYKTDKTAKDLFLEYFDFMSVHNHKLASYSELKSLLSELDCHYDIIPLKECKPETILKAIGEDLSCEADYLDFLKNNCDPLFDVIISRGHCQGDHVEVVIPKDCEIDKKHLQILIDEYLWCTPVYCRLTIDNEEIDLCELLYSDFDYCKQTIIENVHNLLTDQDQKSIETIKSFLINNLPETPDYI